MHGTMMMFGFGPFFFLLVLLGTWFLVGGLSTAVRRGRWRARRQGGMNHESGARRDPQLARLESSIFRLAARRGGRLTLSDVVIETGMGLKEAEGFMDRLANGTHVRLEVSQRGTIYYDFPEIAREKPEQAEEQSTGGAK